ncbi:MAG: Rossmann-like domain protein [Syntrophorhabdus sp. PtaU1.Bin153]|nr:MAG: Rossmann-like domain protein [Syntrophorhabdus sp. PtaU1.Bin153]
MRIGIIGAGKVGISIGHALRRKGFQVTVVSDVAGHNTFDRARQYLGEDILYTTDNVVVAETSDVIAVTTQDGFIKDVATEIAEKGKDLKGKLFFHTSGAHPSSILKPLDEKGALLGSLHPLQTFPDIDSAIHVLPSTYIFVEGTAHALSQLEILGKSIGFTTVPIEGNSKVYYHLSAVFVCNLLCALLYAGEGIMKKIDIGLEPFFPIIKATLENIESKGPLMSLTGPIARGDTGTVEDHIHAMADMDLHRRIYKALSLSAVDMVRRRNILDQETLTTLERTLEAINE